MKKLVAIALVLAVASMANAAISLQPVGGATVNPGQVVTIQLKADGVCNGFNLSAVSDGGKGGVAGALTFGSGLSVLGGGYLDNTAAGILFDTASAYASSAALPAGNVLFSFTYTVGAAAGSVTIAPLAENASFVDIYGDTYIAGKSDGNIGGQSQLIQGVTLNVVPEPMTLGLLGLGGLFLRRRLA